MKKYNTLEIIGFAVLAVGTILWVLESSSSFKFLSPYYQYGQIMFWLGMLIWSFGYMQQQKAERDKSQ